MGRTPRTEIAPCAHEPPAPSSPSPPHTCGGEGREEEASSGFMGRTARPAFFPSVTDAVPGDAMRPWRWGGRRGGQSSMREPSLAVFGGGLSAGSFRGGGQSFKGKPKPPSLGHQAWQCRPTGCVVPLRPS